MTVDMFRGVVPMVDRDTRITPTKYFEPWDREFHFDLDVAAAADNAKCERFFTLEDNGLEQSWKGARVWCNPPYSDIRPWVEKAWRSLAELVVMLLPNWTDREWWQETVEPFRDQHGGRRRGYPLKLTTRFLPQRIRFELPGGFLTPGRPEFGNVLLIWERA